MGHAAIPLPRHSPIAPVDQMLDRVAVVELDLEQVAQRVVGVERGVGASDRTRQLNRAASSSRTWFKISSMSPAITADQAVSSRQAARENRLASVSSRAFSLHSRMIHEISVIA